MDYAERLVLMHHSLMRNLNDLTMMRIPSEKKKEAQDSLRAAIDSLYELRSELTRTKHVI
jgi:hypothetical protein